MAAVSTRGKTDSTKRIADRRESTTTKDKRYNCRRTDACVHERFVRWYVTFELEQTANRFVFAATTYFTGYHGCLRCTYVGVYAVNDIIFDSVGAPLRTDAGFRMRDGPHSPSIVADTFRAFAGFRYDPSTITKFNRK